MSKQANSANRKKKVYEVEQELRSDGWFTFHRGNSHGLFHVVAMKDHLRFIQILRLHKFNFHDINKELSKVQQFIQDGPYPEGTEFELWVWLNNKGWVKYLFRGDQYRKYEDCGDHHFRKKKNIENK